MKIVEQENPDKLINFFNSFINNGKFIKIYEETMALVEKTANYLDKDGRIANNFLKNNGKNSSVLIYTTESMRLTTKLMQMASWVLMVRSYVEKEVKFNKFIEDIKGISLEGSAYILKIEELNNVLPNEFISIIKESDNLLQRIIFMNNYFKDLNDGKENQVVNAVHENLQKLNIFVK